MKPSELLDKPEKWTKGAFARRKTGTRTEWTDERAVCWCMEGALLVCGHLGADEWRKVKDFILVKPAFSARTEGSINEFNDHPDTTFEDVRRVLIEAGL